MEEVGSSKNSAQKDIYGVIERIDARFIVGDVREKRADAGECQIRRESGFEKREEEPS